MGGPQTFTMISTTTKFHKENPKVYAAFVAALKESFAMIKKDKKAAAEVLLESMGGKGWDVDELVDHARSTRTSSTRTKPEGVMKYADFMHAHRLAEEQAGLARRPVLRRQVPRRRQLGPATSDQSASGGASRAPPLAP